MIYLYAHTLNTGGAEVHMHYRTRAVAEWYAMGKSNIAQSYATRVKIPCNWREALINLANDPNWLNELPHERLK